MPPSQNIPFDTFTLAAVAAELRDLVVGSYIQKIQQPSPTDLILSVYGRSGARRILLSVDPRSFRVHLTNVRRENPVNPLGFCQVCRKYLDGATLAEVNMPHFDRVLHLVFRAPDGERTSLIAELVGRNANLILVSGAETVRGVMRHIPSDSERTLRPGGVYAPPPNSNAARDSFTVTEVSDSIFAALPSEIGETKRWLMEALTGINRFAAEEIAARAQDKPALLHEAFVALMDATRTERFAPHSIGSEDGGTTIGVWAFAPYTIPARQRFFRESISTALDTFFSTREHANEEQAERAALGKTLAREITHRQKERDSAWQAMSEAAKADSFDRLGHTLLANLAQVPRGAESVTLPDPYTDIGARITVPLDPALSPNENAQRYFTRARKARDAGEYAEDRLEGLAEEIEALESLATRLATTEAAEEVERVRAELARIVGAARAGEAGAAKRPPAQQRPKEKPFGGHRIRTYTVEGYDLLVGESAEANDYLTTRIAAPSDLWMHVRAAPGAHAILRTNGKPERVPDSIIRRAAGIVAARSGTAIKHASLVAVDVVEKRHVRKPRGGKPGEVLYQRERVFDVAPNLT